VRGKRLKAQFTGFMPPSLRRAVSCGCQLWVDKLVARGQGRLMPVLDLNLLRRGLPAITPEYGAFLAQAAGVCFDRERHISGKQLLVNGEYNATFTALWSVVSDQARLCWNEPKEATEYGAVAVAILLILDLAGFYVIQKSRNDSYATGFDYWLGREAGPPFQNAAKLEISGIGSDASRLHERVKQKLDQIRPLDDCLPAFVIVVEFGTPCAEIQKKK